MGEDEVVVVDSATSEVEQNEEQSKEQDGVKKQEAVISFAKKRVRIHTTDEIDCLVACKPYKIAKDKDVLVPLDVAAILCHAKKAFRV